MSHDALIPPAAPLAAGQSFRSEAPVVVVPETLVMANAPDARRLLDAALEQADRIICDLSNTRFVDSSGLSVLVSALKRARAGGGTVVLLAPQVSVQGLLELTRLVEIFPIARTLADARATLSP